MARDTISTEDGKVIVEVRKTPGNLYINEEHGQLRYGNNDSGVLKWVQPIPVHQVGNAVKRGQPVSIGFPREFAQDTYVRSSGIPLVVPTNPKNHQVATGIAMEPGIADDTKADHVHVVTDGQIRYAKDDPRHTPPTSDYYMPPHKYYVDSSNAVHMVFDWTYDDVGKPVYVDGRKDHEGELTMNIEQAYDGGSNICTIGRLADAPRKIDPNSDLWPSDHLGNKIPNDSVPMMPPGTLIDHPDDKCVCVDIQIMGDARGLTDSTEFSVELDDLPNSYAGPGGTPSGFVNVADYDVIRLVKVYHDGTRVRGRVVMGDDDLSFGNDGSPIGAFIAEKNVDYRNRTIVIHRLGIVRGDFNLSTGDVGRELQLSMGDVSVSGGSTSYEYKVGIVLDTKRVLIDCRFIRQFKKFAPVGEIKPIYATGDLMGDPTDDILKMYVEPGYIAVDDTPHPVYDETAPANKGMLYVLAETIMYKNMVKFYRSKADAEAGVNPIQIYSEDPPGWIPPTGWVPTDGVPMWTAEDLLTAGAWFVFEDIYYKIGDGKIGSMIKYATEGSPDNLQVIWPWQTFTGQTLDMESGGSSLTPGLFRLNITGLVNMGSVVVKDNNTYIADDFEISMIVADPAAPTGSSQAIELQNLEGMILSPGFYTVEVEETYNQILTSGYDSDHQPPFYTTDVTLFPSGAGWGASRTVTEKRTKYCGYEWKIRQETAFVGNTYWLDLVTDPSFSDVPLAEGFVSNCDVYGVCYPPGVPLRDKPMNGNPPKWDRQLNVSVVVRRRPTEYTDLSLNQLYFNMPWNVDVWSDGAGVIGLTGLHFGMKRALFDSSGRVSDVDWRTTHDMKLGLSGTSVVSGDWDYINDVPGSMGTSPIAVQEVLLGGVETSTGQLWYPTVLEQIYKVKGPGNLTPIILTYDFNRTAISSNALMAFKYYSPTSYAALTRPGRKWYFDPSDSFGKMGDLVWGRKALQSIYEIPIGLWNYVDDSQSQIDFGGERISPFDQLFRDQMVSSNTNRDNHDYSKLDVRRNIWPQLATSGLQTMSYIYTGPEILAIEADRKSTYGRDLADQNIQSNIGLLTQGLGDAHERLLKIERSLYGADMDSLPGSLSSNVQSWVTRHGNFYDSITDYGALRLTKQLMDLKFLVDEDRAGSGQENVPLWSWWINVLSEVLGWIPGDPSDIHSYGHLHKWVFLDGDLPPFNNSRLASNLTMTGDGTGIEGGNVSEVWFWLNFLLGDWRSTVSYAGSSGSVWNPSPFDMNSADRTRSYIENTAWFRADHIFFKRSDPAVNTVRTFSTKWEDNSSLFTGEIPEKFNVLYGPAGLLANFVYNSTHLGKSDARVSSETYASQSLEGIVNDVTMRISLWKWQFDAEFGVMKSDISMYGISMSNFHEDIGLDNDVTGISYTYLKTGYANTFVNFARPEMALTNLTNHWWDYISVMNDNESASDRKNKFVTALGMDQKGKIQVPAALVLKGLVNMDQGPNGRTLLSTARGLDLLSEYRNTWTDIPGSYSATDYDAAQIIDARTPSIRDTRIPILGVYGNAITKYSRFTAPRKGVPTLDPNYMALNEGVRGTEGAPELNSSGGQLGYQEDSNHDHSKRPSIFRVRDQVNHPNYQRYILEVVADIPGLRDWTDFDQIENEFGTTSKRRTGSAVKDRSSFDLFMLPEYERRTYKEQWPLPNRMRELTDDDGNFVVLHRVPTNYQGYVSEGAEPIRRDDIPEWARMNADGDDVGNIPYGITLMLNEHQFPIPKIPVHNENIKVHLPRIHSFVIPTEGDTSPIVGVPRIQYNGSPLGPTEPLGERPTADTRVQRTFVPASDGGSTATIFEENVVLVDGTAAIPLDWSPGGPGYYTTEVTEAEYRTSYWMYYFDFEDIISKADGDIQRSAIPMFVAPSGKTQLSGLNIQANTVMNLIGNKLKFLSPAQSIGVTTQVNNWTTFISEFVTYIKDQLSANPGTAPIPTQLTFNSTVSTPSLAGDFRILGSDSADISQVSSTDNRPILEMVLENQISVNSQVYLPDTIYLDEASAIAAGASMVSPSLTAVDSGLGDIETLRYWTIGAMATNGDGNLIDSAGNEILVGGNPVNGKPAIEAYLRDPANVPPNPEVVGHEIPTSWNYDKLNSIHLRRPAVVTYDKTTSVDINVPLKLSDVHVESVYLGEKDQSTWIDVPRAKETIAFKLPDQRQTVTILKNQLSALGNFTVEYPKTTKLNTGLKIAAGTTNQNGQLPDSDLVWNFSDGKSKLSWTLDDLIEGWRGSSEFDTTPTSGIPISQKKEFLDMWDSMVTTGEYETHYDFEALSNYINDGNNFSNPTDDGFVSAIRIRLNGLVRKKAGLDVDPIDSSIYEEELERRRSPLELHFRGMLDGTAMPESALWIDIPNAELYVKFSRHISKIMALAVRVEDYMPNRDMQAQGEFALERNNPEWPWDNPSRGFAEQYPITITSTKAAILPDLPMKNPRQVPMPITYEEYMLKLGVPIDLYIGYYGSTLGDLCDGILGSGQKPGFTFETVFGGELLYMNADISILPSRLTPIVPGMKFWVADATIALGLGGTP